MQNSNAVSLRAELRTYPERRFSLTELAVILVLLLAPPMLVRGQSTPAEDFGPYNAVFLSDGPGLN